MKFTMNWTVKSFQKRTLFFIIGLSLFSPSAWSASDFLAEKTLTINDSNPQAVLDRTLGNIKAIFLRFKPKIDPDTRVKAPLTVGGTTDRPVLKMSVEKCVLFICQQVDLDIEVSAQRISGSCAQNFTMRADLRRSSRLLSDIYDRIDVSGCFKPTGEAKASLHLVAQVHRAPNYGEGTTQREVFKLLQSQIDPIIQAVNETLRANGSKFQPEEEY